MGGRRPPARRERAQIIMYYVMMWHAMKENKRQRHGQRLRHIVLLVINDTILYVQEFYAVDNYNTLRTSYFTSYCTSYRTFYRERDVQVLILNIKTHE